MSETSGKEESKVNKPKRDSIRHPLGDGKNEEGYAGPPEEPGAPGQFRVTDNGTIGRNGKVEKHPRSK